MKKGKKGEVAYYTKTSSRQQQDDDEDWPACDRDVPRFDGTPAKYEQYRARMILYATGCEIEGDKRLKLLPNKLVQGLSGTAFDQLEGTDLGRQPEGTTDRKVGWSSRATC